MQPKRNIIHTSLVILATLVGWGIFRLLFPIFDYFPPELLIRDLEPSWIITAGIRKAAGVVYLSITLILMAVFFGTIQQRWSGKRGLKGLVFGTWIGGVWSFGFLTGWAFLGTTFRAEFLNIIVDLIPLAIAGWLIGLAVGRDVPASKPGMWQPWLAVLLIAFGFVAVHTLGANLLVDRVGPSAKLLLLPTTIPQIVLLFALGAWVGGMYVILRSCLPFNKTRAQVAFFAFGVFGHCWTWFNLFFVIEFADVLPTILLLGFIGSAGVFTGALTYEGFAGRKAMSE